MAKRGMNHDFRQQIKHKEQLAKKDRYSDEYEYGNYPKPLTLNLKYLLELDSDTYVITVKEKRKDRQKRCYYYKAEVEQFTPIIESDSTEYYSWNMYYGGGIRVSNNTGEDGLREMKHSSSHSYKLRILTDSGYAKLFLTMDTVDETKNEIY